MMDPAISNWGSDCSSRAYPHSNFAIKPLSKAQAWPPDLFNRAQ